MYKLMTEQRVKLIKLYKKVSHLLSTVLIVNRIIALQLSQNLMAKAGRKSICSWTEVPLF